MKRIAVVHPIPMYAIGGGEVLFFKIVRMLRKKYEVDAFHSETFEAPNDINSRKIKIPFPFNRLHKIGFKLKEELLRRNLRKMLDEEDYDLVFCNGGFFKYKEDIPTVNYFYFVCNYGPLQFYKKYFGGDKIKEIFNGLHIATISSKTKNDIVKYFSIPPEKIEVLYQPVRNDFPHKKWDRRENGFVNVGRICPRKKQLEMARLVKKLNQYIDIHIHFIGRKQETNIDYFKKLKKEEDKKIIFVHEDASDEELKEILTNHKYALHLTHEGFGTAVAEYVNAGCIPFVYDKGAQVEIVDYDKRLICNYSNAKNKILRVLTDKELEKSIKSKMKKLEGKFSDENFEKKLLEYVSDIIDQKN